jgi:class 3 adenylate cyclase
METSDLNLYKDRFENLFRVAKKITASLNIGDILENIRDEVKITVPHAREACLILVDPDAPAYTRPLHCPAQRSNVNCQLCKRGKRSVEMALGTPVAFQCVPGGDNPRPISEALDEPACEVAMPIHDGDEPLAVLSVVTEEGYTLNERDMVLLTDLTDLATNTIINAKKHRRMAAEKLTLERIMGHIRPFVPETVQRIVEKDPEAPLPGKRELDVSILFLDVADYTRISTTLTRDKVNFIIEKYFSAFLDSIYKHGGDVNETAGDGLMAIFQGGEKEHALNAAAAALAIRSGTAKINKELQGRFFPLLINMGINSGPALVGMSRFSGESHTRMTYTASGAVTNLASRIASAAKDGEILVGPETASRIGDKMVLYDRGPMSFKNMPETVHVYSLVPLES